MSKHSYYFLFLVGQIMKVNKELNQWSVVAKLFHASKSPGEIVTATTKDAKSIVCRIVANLEKIQDV